ncbi:MAG: hypothetical protein ACTS2F_07885 [Thainema sp.]
MQNLNCELLLSDLNSQRFCQIFGHYLRNVIIDYKVHLALKQSFQCWDVAAGQKFSMLQAVLMVRQANCRKRQRKALSAPKVLGQLRFWCPAAVAVAEVAYR